MLTQSDGAREGVDLEAGGRRASDDASVMPEPVAASAIDAIESTIAAVAATDAGGDA